MKFTNFTKARKNKMIKLNNIENVYFVGVGGIGMSALARYFKAIGKNVYGYDRTKTELTDALTNEGIEITFEDNVENIPGNVNALNSIIVYTPAIPDENLILNYFKQNNFKITKRAEVLGLIFNDKKGIAISGTHGKTSISTLVAYLLDQSNYKFSAFVGGISKNFNSNLVLNQNSEYIVAEADEFDRSFLHLYPNTALISSIDADHLDIYGKKEELKRNFETFANQIDKNGNLIYKYGLKLKLPEVKNIYTYSLNNDKADFYAQNIKIENQEYTFDLITPKGKYTNIKLGIPGLVNIENAVAALSLCCAVNIDIKSIIKEMPNFKGVKRRFDYIIKQDNFVYIDDYAHHPEELKATIKSVRDLYKDKIIAGIFQPHLYTRTRDFATEFAQSLDLLDQVIILDIYPAREKAIPGVNSKIIFDKMKIKNKFLSDKNNLINNLKNINPDILLSLGAGDIDKEVEKIKNYYLNK